MSTPPKLLGTSQTPAFSSSDVVTCARRGDVRVVGLSAAPIPWPVGRLVPARAGRSSLVLFGDLADAVRRESAEAVMHFWGVKANTVWQWRKTTLRSHPHRHPGAFEVAVCCPGPPVAA